MTNPPPGAAVPQDGGPAFPGAELPAHPNHPTGMSLRDWFAGTMDKDEYGDLAYKHLSRAAKEAIVGRQYPEEPSQYAVSEVRVEYQLKALQWELELRARVRFMHADALLSARGEAK